MSVWNLPWNKRDLHEFLRNINGVSPRHSYARGGKVGLPNSDDSEPVTLTRAEGVYPDGEGGLIHWQDIGGGYIKTTPINPDEYREDESE